MYVIKKMIAKSPLVPNCDSHGSLLGEDVVVLDADKNILYEEIEKHVVRTSTSFRAKRARRSLSPRGLSRVEFHLFVESLVRSAAATFWKIFLSRARMKKTLKIGRASVGRS